MSSYEFSLLTQGYLQINPQHSIPVLSDDDLLIVESRAALLHLARKYETPGRSSLLPKDEIGLSLVEQRLYFDLEHIWPFLKKVIVSRDCFWIHQASADQVVMYVSVYPFVHNIKFIFVRLFDP